jgi:hypothetical protein
MSGCELCDRTCRYCSVEIMYVGVLWLKRRVAHVNGFCPQSPDDLHHPVSEAGPQHSAELHATLTTAPAQPPSVPATPNPAPGRPR